MQDFTLDNEFSEFLKNEQKLINEHFDKENMSATEITPVEPGKEAVDRILAYNKALSVRQSRLMNPITIVLN